MLNNLMSETRIGLPALAAELNVNRRTVVRWVTEGYKGNLLASYRIGMKRFTTREAVARFLAAMNGEQVIA